METASATQVAKSFNVPFLGIRILSNSEWQEGENFDPNAAIYCAEFVTEVIKAIASKVEFPVQSTVHVNQEK